MIDASTQTEIAVIDIPGAFGLDDTPDHKTLYVGTQIGDLYTVDTVAMTVTHRYLATSLGPVGFRAFSAQVLVDGRVALLGGQGGIPNVDGYASFGVWNPADNSMTVYAGSAPVFPPGPSVTVVCGPMGTIAGFSRSADRTKILIGSAFSDATLCEVDPATSKFNYTSVFVYPVKFSLSPDGKYIAAPSFGSPGSVVLLDTQTLAMVAQFTVSGETTTAASIGFSADSSKLFITSNTIVYAYSVTTHQLVGWTSNIDVQPISGGLNTGPGSGPDIRAIDNTGLLAGPMEEGVGFIDTSSLHTGAVGTQFTNGYLNPESGPIGGGTAVKISDPNTVGSSLSAVFFGAQTAPATFSGGVFSITSPTGLPGPTDVLVQMSDGGQWVISEGFSYGPAIVQATPNASTAEGGGIGIVYGYGFGPLTGSSIPSDLQITVGSQSATLLAYSPNAYGLLSPPFQLEAFTFRIPPGTAGTQVDITVSNSSGSTIAHSAMSYLPATQTFAASSAPLAQGIYDAHRDVYYFTDASQVRVFSRTQGKFLALSVDMVCDMGAYLSSFAPYIPYVGAVMLPGGALAAVGALMVGVGFCAYESASRRYQRSLRRGGEQFGNRLLYRFYPRRHRLQQLLQA